MTDDEVGDVVPFVPARLLALRAAETVLADAEVVLAEARAEHGAIADEWRRYEWAVKTQQPYDTDPRLEDAGPKAVAVIEAAFQTFRLAQEGVRFELAALVGTGELVVGDVLQSPYCDEPLTVAVIYQPEEVLLSEATLTADGLPIVTSQHRAILDRDRRPVPYTGPEIRYERWSVNGRRAAGTVHPDDRKLIRTIT